MATGTFVDILSNLRRKAQLSGRPLSKQETAGVVSGYADVASERLARGRQLDIQEKSEERQYRTARKQMKRDRRTEDVASVGGGAAIGAHFGSAAGGIGAVPGAVVGGVIGGVVSIIKKNCIIITACTDPNSYEVNVSRIYRDNFMGYNELTGYYRLAVCLVPFIRKYPLIKRLTKHYLVDRLVDYGEVSIGVKTQMARPMISTIVTKGFLGLCSIIGALSSKQRSFENG